MLVRCEASSAMLESRFALLPDDSRAEFGGSNIQRNVGFTTTCTVQ